MSRASVEVRVSGVAVTGGGVGDVDVAVAEGVLGLVAVIEHPAADAAHHNNHYDQNSLQHRSLLDRMGHELWAASQTLYLG